MGVNGVLSRDVKSVEGVGDAIILGAPLMVADGVERWGV